MNIEIAEPGHMTQSGSSLFRLIQNNNMPILDLLVRESVQNSLDAKEPDAAYVNVEFLTGQFDSHAFNHELSGISGSLDQRYPDPHYSYIAIRDSNTVGLTGPLNIDSVQSPDNYGNLLKLVYEISKPQSEEGAGGSWGLGKTVYFRVGIGLVLYYSRIRTSEGFASRMAVTFVEDETSREAIIPQYNGMLKRGIAWWGKSIGTNKTEPLTDEEEIEKVLSCFHIGTYSGTETGTTIIIPYIHEERLLHNNETEYLDMSEQPYHLFWRNDVQTYLNIALQRWYAPRIGNESYPNGPFLNAAVNGSRITPSNMEPVYQVIQQLYNTAKGARLTSNVLAGADVNREEICIRKSLEETGSGVLSFVQVSDKALRMTPPDNNPDPYMYFECENPQGDQNRTIVCFTRKPGMIVSYRDMGSWADGLPLSDHEHYIIAIFVLNSANRIQNHPEVSLEEYARRSEMADHADWTDYSVKNSDFNPKIITKTQKQILKKICSVYAPEEKTEEKNWSGYSRLYADLLLPPENFGHRASGLPGSGERGERSVRGMTLSFSDDTVYGSSTVRYHAKIRSGKKIRGFRLYLGIDSENGQISLGEWTQKLGLSKPFEIEKVEIPGKDDKVQMVLCKDQTEMGNWKILAESDGTQNTVLYQTDNNEKIRADLYIWLKIYQRDIGLEFTVSELKEDS